MKVAELGASGGTEAGYIVRPIGTVSSPRRGLEDDGWGPVRSTMTLLPPLDERALVGLGEFSHVEIVYLFDRVDPDGVCLGARRPRGNPRWPEIGILAQRAKDRPNRIGVSVCTLVAVEGSSITVQGLDAVNGTPVLDVKPYMPEFAPRGQIRRPEWVAELMAEYF